MKDLVTKGTGNSRTLKSSIPAGTTWEEALALLRAGNFPIDLKGLNSAGVSSTGSAYNKANVLPDSLCTSLGITSSTAEPKDAWNALLQKTNTSNTTFNNFVSNDWPYPYKQGVARPNLLENWYFYGGGSQQGGGQFPINQKGTTSQTEAGYFIDRWQKANTTGTVSLSTAGMTITGSGSSYNYIKQPIEHSARLFGKQVTASLLNSSGALTSVTGTFPSSLPSSTTSYGNSSAIGNVRIKIMGNSSYFYVELDCSAASSTAVVAVKLELGPNQTLARQVGSTWVPIEIPHFATELQKCQRHMAVFQRVSTATRYNSYPEDVIGFGLSGNPYNYVAIPTPVTMRTTPTVSGTVYLHNGTDAGDFIGFSSSSIRGTWLRTNMVSLQIYSTQLSYDKPLLVTAGTGGITLDANL